MQQPLNRHEPQSLHDRLLAVPEITAHLRISRSLWWRWVKEGRAPQGIKLSARCTRWRASDVAQLIDTLAAPK